MNKIKYILLLIVLFASFVLHAQVGIHNNASKATLHISPTSTTASTAEGLIAPNLTRAQLIAKDARYGTDQTGAQVYVTAIDGTVTTKTAGITRPGYYFFDGSVWINNDQPGHYFYLPHFTLPTSVIGTGYTFDLYNSVYKLQFNQSGNASYNVSNSWLTTLPIARYTPTELDYVVTYYDREVITINSISNTGIINYDVINPVTGTSSFINVVLITKK